MILLLTLLAAAWGAPANQFECLLNGGRWVDGQCVEATATPAPATPAPTTPALVERIVTLDGSPALPTTDLGRRDWDRLTIRLRHTLPITIPVMVYGVYMVEGQVKQARSVAATQPGSGDCIRERISFDPWTPGEWLHPYGITLWQPELSMHVWWQLTPAQWDDLAGRGALFCVGVAPVCDVGKIQGACFKVELQP